MKARKKKMTARPLAAVATATACAAAATLALPALAFAEETETAGISAILPEMNEFVPMLVAFIILLVILVKFGWPMFDKVLVTRESTIRDNIEKAEAARIESERVLEEYKKQLADAKSESAAIVAEAKQSGEALRQQLSEQAQAEADQMIAKAKDAIEAEKKAAIAELSGSVADLTVEVTSRVIGEDFSDADHRKLIERQLQEVGSLDVR